MSVNNVSSLHQFNLCTAYFDRGLKTNTTDCPVFKMLMDFDLWYKAYHGYISAILCICGVLSNILNSMVLTKKSMINPINLILLGIALSDMIKMLSYSIYTIYLNLATAPNPCDYPHSYHWILFVLIHSSIVICTHTTSTLLVVILAIFRAWTLTNMATVSRLQYKHSIYAIVSLFSISFIFSLPNFFLQEVTAYENRYYWFIGKAGFQTEQHIQFALYGCVVKSLSTIVLVILTIFIIIVMRKSSKLKRQLNVLSKNIEMLPLRGSRHQNSPRDPYHKASMLLVTVVLCFVFTELPQGIINTIAAIEFCFLESVYIYIGDMMDVLVLINSSINFILYCVMSKQFRDTFSNMFLQFCRR